MLDINKYIILYNNNINTWMQQQLVDMSIQCLCINRSSRFIDRQVKKIAAFFHSIAFNNYIYNKNNIEKYIANHRGIIVFDTIYSNLDLTWLRIHFPTLRIILWFWNPVGNTVLPQDITARDIELWTYSITDSEKYGLHYNTPFYPLQNAVSYDEVNEYDVIFWGRNKHRKELIACYDRQFKKIGLDTRIHITPDRWFQSFYQRNMSRYVPYDKIIADIMRSRSILDIYTNPMAGLSLRTMEALFYKKKLITNSIEIKKYDFYSKANVFILGEDNIQYLADFVKSPYIDVDPRIVCKYSATSWLKRFDA